MRRRETAYDGANPWSPLALLLLLIAWQNQAQALFCFTLGGQARHDGRFDARAWQPPPPPPQLFSPYHPIQTLQRRDRTGDEPPPIRKTKKSPEVIQGYRFRPLSERESRTEPVPPRDWRD